MQNFKSFSVNGISKNTIPVSSTIQPIIETRSKTFTLFFKSNNTLVAKILIITVVMDININTICIFILYRPLCIDKYSMIFINANNFSNKNNPVHSILQTGFLLIILISKTFSYFFNRNNRHKVFIKFIITIIIRQILKSFNTTKNRSIISQEYF